MDFNDDQLALRNLVEKTLRNECPAEEVRKLMEMDDGYSEGHGGVCANF